MAAQQTLIPPGKNADRIFTALSAYPYGLKMQELIPHVYPDPDKEPDYATTSLYVCICNMNKWWCEHHSFLRIHGHGGPGSRYQIWIVK